MKAKTLSKIMRTNLHLPPSLSVCRFPLPRLGSARRIPRSIRNDGSCGPGTARETRRGEFEEARRRCGDNSGNADYKVDVVELLTSPSTRNASPFKGHILVPGRMSRWSSHTHNGDDGVPPMVAALFPGPFSQGRIPDRLSAVVEEAPSSNASGAGDEDLAQMSKSMSYMDGRSPLHSR